MSAKKKKKMPLCKKQKSTENENFRRRPAGENEI